MAHSEIQQFLFGKTLRVKTEVIKAKDFEYEPPDDGYTHQSIAGIAGVEYNAGIGTDTEDWQELENGLDIGEIFRENAQLKKDLKGQKMHNGKLRKRLQSMGVLDED